MQNQASRALDFIESKINNTKSARHFRGISRHSFPTWVGWRLIDAAIEKGIDPEDLSDAKLEILVNNHWYIEYIRTLVDGQGKRPPRVP